MLTSFAKLGKRRFPNWYTMDPFKMTPQMARERRDKHMVDGDIADQEYIDERHETLGSDLATAHFIVHRKGKIRFKDQHDWVYLKKGDETSDVLPGFYERKLFLEAIDASNTQLCYEGLVNLTNLKYLKWLSLRNCCYVDDWFVDRISGLFGETLEHLDLSDCPSVTENSLSCFYKFKNLKCLILNNVKTKSFKLSCLLLEENVPLLDIKGVVY